MPIEAGPVAVDLFSGAGGLSFGLKQAGVEVAAGIDLDPHCRHPFEHNVRSDFHEQDISSLDTAFVDSLYPRCGTRVLVGCAPCQPYSTYAHKHSARDQRWRLLGKLGAVVKELRPEIVTIENVPQLKRHSIFNDLLRTLTDSGYADPYVEVVECAKYGIPQSRKRLVVLASRMGHIELGESSANSDGIPTVRQFIHGLEEIEAGSSSKSDPIHKASGLSPINMERIAHSRPGGTWRDWPERLQAPCHTKDTGRTYSSVYGRMTWDDPAPTLTTQFNGFGNGRFGHPEQDRAISLREGALLQTFPVEYSFVPDGKPVMTSRVAMMIGNAVPVNLGKAIGLSIVEHLERG